MKKVSLFYLVKSFFVDWLALVVIGYSGEAEQLEMGVWG